MVNDLSTLSQEYHEFFLENEDLVLLYENYSDSEIYTEIVNFLEIYQPEWRKFKGLGRMAPEYILTIIENCNPFDETSEKFTDFLTRLYIDLVDSYKQYQSTNDFNRNDIFSSAFVNFYQGLGFTDFEEPKDLSENDYANNTEKVNMAWDLLTETENKVFQEFKQWEDETVYLWF